MVGGGGGLDYLQDRAKGSVLYGFKGGPAGIMKCKYVELNADYIYPYRNQVKFSSFQVFYVNVGWFRIVSWINVFVSIFLLEIVNFAVMWDGFELIMQRV